MGTTVKKSLYGLTLNDLSKLMSSKGMAKFRASQVYGWAHKKRVHDSSKWSNIPKEVKEFVTHELGDFLPKVTWVGESQDGTVKFLMEMREGHNVECVLIPAPGRMTICLSSQVGCAIGCTFCYTGTMGLTRNLEPDEIVGQYLIAQSWLDQNKEGFKITNLVYMGQGEPLHNFERVKKATQIFLEPEGIGLGQRRITLSTSGLVPQIEKLFDFPPINYAISLHAAHNDVRSELMPINKAYDLERLLAAIKKIPLKAHRYITFEYLLIEGLNDSQKDLDGLGKLLDSKISKINLIPFNEHPGSPFKRPTRNRVRWFCSELEKMGFRATIRVTKGDDILAACGQLKNEFEKRADAH